MNSITKDANLFSSLERVLKEERHPTPMQRIKSDYDALYLLSALSSDRLSILKEEEMDEAASQILAYAVEEFTEHLNDSNYEPSTLLSRAFEYIGTVRKSIEEKFKDVFNLIDPMIERNNVFVSLQILYKNTSTRFINMNGARTIQSPEDRYDTFNRFLAALTIEENKFADKKHLLSKRQLEDMEIRARTETQYVLDELERMQLKKPVEILIYKTSNNKVRAKFNLHGNGSYKFVRGQKPRWNKGEDAAIWPQTINVEYLEEFLDLNDISSNDYIMSPESIKSWYQFYDVVSTKLTKAFVDEWLNYDCPDLCVYSPNIELSTNMLGMTIPIFRDNLLEVGYSSVYVSKSADEKDLEAIAGHLREDSWIKEAIEASLESRKISEHDEELLIESVKDYDKKVQDVFDKYKENIVQATLTKLGIPILDHDMGLDCGFMSIFSKNAEYKNAREILSNRGWSKSMDVRLPFTQSVTVQRELFNQAKHFVDEELGADFDLYCTTRLD